MRARVEALSHQLGAALHDAVHAGFADEEMVRLLGEHEAGRARERVESRLRQGGQLILAVAVGEHGEHEEAQPVVDRLVEGIEDARLVARAASPLEQLVRFLAAVAAEVAVEQVDHRPQVTAFFDVDLEEVAQVVQGRTGLAQLALLLDRGRLGVGLRDDDAAE